MGRGMNNFKSIRARLMAGFSIVLAMIFILGTYIVITLNGSNNSTKDIANIELPLLIADEQLALAMANQLATSRGYILTGENSYKVLFDEYTEKRQNYNEIVQKIGAKPEFEELMTKAVDWTAYIEEEVFAQYEKGNEELALENLISANPVAREVMNSFIKMASDREELIQQTERTMLVEGQRTIYIASGIVILVLLLSVIVAIYISNAISRPIKVVMDRMGLIAGGDLSGEPLDNKLKDEIGQLIAATNSMTSNTRNLINEVNIVSGTVSTQSEVLTQSADEVKAGTAQISVTMEDLATGTESQANNASILSSIMESFVVKVMEANESGEQILQSSSTVLSMTDVGQQLMESSTAQMQVVDQIVHDAVQRVEGLDKHSQEISELVSVIQDIAGQTNLLALNAAIEAARAGEHGKGFSVVADEVRKLAEQSSASVTNITEIVNRIQSESSSVASSLQDGYREVERGTAQIIETGETFGKINQANNEMVERIRIVSNNLSDMAASSQEMSGSIEEIAAISEESAAGVEQTSASSQQASSAMEEVANSLNDLAKLARELDRLIRQFKL